MATKNIMFISVTAVLVYALVMIDEWDREQAATGRSISVAVMDAGACDHPSREGQLHARPRQNRQSTNRKIP
ncbi:MAG: hypothetical protein KC470_08805 [Dehalococcoidia bacterium]|nr:hypothetical protein [Dehalococcoidia bacterium]